MSTFNEDMEQIKQACHDMGDALEDVFPPRAIVVLAAVLYVAFVVGWCWVMRGMTW